MINSKRLAVVAAAIIATGILTGPATAKSTRASARPARHALPNPILHLTGTENYTSGGKPWVRYTYDVLNKAKYPAAMFAPAPSLPPCGLNARSSRSWVDFFDSKGKRLYGFCALTSPQQLDSIWFAIEQAEVPPNAVYIEINDRQTHTKYKSNLAGTTR
jgi:hypothetical protein